MLTQRGLNFNLRALKIIPAHIKNAVGSNTFKTSIFSFTNLKTQHNYATTFQTLPSKPHIH